MGAAQVVLLTGASGAVGRPLLAALLAVPEVERIYALAHVDGVPAPDARVHAVTGDITAGADLGLEPALARRLAHEVTAVIHAAADTRFSSPFEVGARTNVEGTGNVLAFAARCPRLDRVLALSTTHVAGRRTGVIREDDLEHDSGFVNDYERTKHAMEREVRARMAVLPLAVCRLSTIAGDSRSGAVSRRGALHQAVLLLYASLAPMLPGSEDSPVDLVALDYAASSVGFLATRGFAAGRTWHVCGGTDALGVGELLDLTMRCIVECRPAWRRRAIERPVLVDLDTFELFRRSVEDVGDSALRASTEVVARFAPQLAFPKRFDDAGCQAALAGSGITRPAIRDVWRRVVSHLVQPCPT
jgi:nucleoside-diphosphate-sugar epimerase